jgi:hypothetical protein
METRCSSMERIYKGTQLVVGNVKRSTISASTPFRLRWNIALSMLSPLKCGAVNARGSRHKTRPQGINARAVKICRPPHNIYEPLLGENRELGEIPDSTLITNPRLI